MRTFSKTFQNRAAKVVAYIDANPGETAQEIAYHLNLAVSTVHDILLNDTMANMRVRQGMVPALDYVMKPRWYRHGMPVVKTYSLNIVGEFQNRLDAMITDPSVRSQIAPLLAQVSKIVQPSKSIRQRKRDGNTFVSGVQLIAAGYQSTVESVRDIVPRLADVEGKLALLTAPESLRQRYGSTALRKNRA